MVQGVLVDQVLLSDQVGQYHRLCLVALEDRLGQEGLNPPEIQQQLDFVFDVKTR